MEEGPSLYGQANESRWLAALQPTAGVLTAALSCTERHDIPQLPHNDTTFYLYQTPLLPGERCVFPTLIQ